MAGFPDQRAIWLATIPGASSFIFTIAGLLLVDRLGRRKLLIGSSIGVVFSFAFLSGIFFVMNTFSLPSRPFTSDAHRESLYMCAYHTCGSCVGNSECGFCGDYDPETDTYFNGTCLPAMLTRNGSSLSRYRPATGGGECAVWGQETLQASPDTTSQSTEESTGGEDTVSTMTNSNNGSLSSRKGSGLIRKWFPHSCPDNRFAPLAVVALFFYIATFASGWGLVPWTVNSEIYPTWARSTAISIATTTNWACNLLVSMTFLTMADSLGQPLTFGVYGLLSFVALWFVVSFLPETKGRTLEDMAALFRKPYFLTCWKM